MTLRTRVLMLALGSVVGVLVLLAVPVTLLVHQNADDEARNDAVAVAQGIADYVSTGVTSQPALQAYVARVNGRDDPTPATVVLADQSIVGADQPRCADPDTDGDVDGLTGEGDTDQDGGGETLAPTTAATVVPVTGGRLLRIRTAQSGGVVTVCSYVSDQSISHTVRDRLGLLGAAAALVVMAVGGLALVVTRHITRPLMAASTTADRIADGDLAARVADAGPPEVRTVGIALNRLAGRIEELLRHERETVADLSHRLRTPLTAVRLDVESLPASPGKAQLEAHLAQVERTLSSVINTARRLDREGVDARTEVMAVVRDRFEFWEPLLEEQHRSPALRAQVPENTAARLAPDDLAAALDALLANAIGHTPHGTAVDVVVTLVGEHVQVDVRDQGPGIPETALARGRSDRGSTGLGLDIARTTAEAAGGGLSLVDDGVWKVVRLQLACHT